MKTTLLVLLTSAALALQAQAGSATWNLNPATAEWNKAGNWTPTTVPNGPDDTATFDVSNLTSLTLTQAEVASVVFNPGASAYHIRATTGINGAGLTFSGAGIVNHSGLVQSFEVSASPAGRMAFFGEATAGEGTVFTVAGGSNAPSVSFYETASAGRATFISNPGPDNQHPSPGMISFAGSATAADGTFICNGGITTFAAPGTVSLGDEATAGQGTFTAHGAATDKGIGGDVGFYDFSNAGEATITAEGSDLSTFGGAMIRFYHESSAADATLIATGGALDGGWILFADENTEGARARVELFGNGRLEIYHVRLTIGSLEGDGRVLLGTLPLSIGSNNLSTTFAGVMSGTGSLAKIGTGHLSLTNANTYAAGTTVRAGALRVGNLAGSATGPGPVQVNGGVLGGGGIIAGAVTIGSGSDVGAELAPSAGASRPTVTTILSVLTFKADGTYTCKLNSRKGRADQIVANGVTIESGARFNLAAVANRKLAAGVSFSVIRNTAATPIYGTFANLPEGGTISVGPNTFQASYSGGDGNDLTLTVMP